MFKYKNTPEKLAKMCISRKYDYNIDLGSGTTQYTVLCLHNIRDLVVASAEEPE